MIGVNLAGAEFGTLPGRYGYSYVYPNADELDYFKSLGMELIRLPFKWERVQPQLGGELDQAEVGRIHQFLDAAHARGIEVVLDVHNYGRYNDGSGNHVIGSAAVPVSAFADFWARMAVEFDGDPAIRGFGLMNEPHDMGGAHVWSNAAQAAVDAIRATGSTETIMVSGDGWSSAHRWPEVNPGLPLDDPLDNVVYEAHVYFDQQNLGTYSRSYDQEGAFPALGAQRLAPFLNWLQEHDVQGYIGEFGAPGDDPRWLTVLGHFVDALNLTGLDGTAWAAGPAWGAYPLSLEPKDGKDKPQIDVLTAPPPASADSFHVFDNTILGSAAGEIIDRAAASVGGSTVYIYGLAGDDTLVAGAAPDRLDGGAGSDTASYAASAAPVNINLQTGAIRGGAAEGDGFVSIENLAGSAWNDRLEGDQSANRLDGGGGNDTVSYQYSKSAVVVDLGATAAQVSGGSADADVLTGFENVAGSAFGDTLAGDAGSNGLDGAGGNDTLTGGEGRDTLVGGAGDDTFVVDDKGDILAENASEGNDTVRASVGVSLPGNIENLTLTGTADVNGNGNAADNVMTGNAGRNGLTGLGGNDTLSGAAGDDLLIGSAGADRLDGGVGIDTASYAASAERVDVSLLSGNGHGGDAEGDTLSAIENLTGSPYGDLFEGNAKANVLDAGAGADTVTYEHSDAGVTVDLSSGAPQSGPGDANGDVLLRIENVIGSALDDTLIGSAGVNVLTGGSGGDVLDGRGGADTLVGRAGDDVYDVENAADLVVERPGEGTDTVRATISFALPDDAENLTLLGSGNIDGTGNAAANVISGNVGRNVLAGGQGNDALTGGASGDTFVFEAGFGRDTIGDFAAGAGIADVMEFRDGPFADFAAVQAASQQVGADVHIAVTPSDTIVLTDVSLANLNQDDFRFV